MIHDQKSNPSPLAFKKEHSCSEKSLLCVTYPPTSSEKYRGSRAHGGNSPVPYFHADLPGLGFLFFLVRRRVFFARTGEKNAGAFLAPKPFFNAKNIFSTKKGVLRRALRSPWRSPCHARAVGLFWSRS